MRSANRPTTEKEAVISKKRRTVLPVILILAIAVIAAGIALLTNQLLIARVLEVQRNGVLVEVCNTKDYRWIDRKFGGCPDYEYIRLYVKDPSGLKKGQFFAAVTRPGEESSSPPGIGARWIFR